MYRVLQHLWEAQQRGSALTPGRAPRDRGRARRRPAHARPPQARQASASSSTRKADAFRLVRDLRELTLIDLCQGGAHRAAGAAERSDLAERQALAPAGVSSVRRARRPAAKDTCPAPWLSFFEASHAEEHPAPDEADERNAVLDFRYQSSRSGDPRESNDVPPLHESDGIAAFAEAPGFGSRDRHEGGQTSVYAARRAEEEHRFVSTLEPPGEKGGAGLDLANNARHAIERLSPRSLKYLSSQLQSLVEGTFVVEGFDRHGCRASASGIVLGPSVGLDTLHRIASAIGDWLALPGQVFLGLIQMIVVPLVFASVIRGLAASESLDYLRRMGAAAVLFFVVTTALAIVLGIVLALWIQPGVVRGPRRRETSARIVFEPRSFPTRPPRRCRRRSPRRSSTSCLPTRWGRWSTRRCSKSCSSPSSSAWRWCRWPRRALGLILELFGSVQEVTMAVVRYAMRLAPIAVFGLMAQLTTKLGLDALVGMSVYVGTAIAGLFLLLVLYLVIVSSSSPSSRPLRSTSSAVREVQLLAFSTSSSAAVMPISIKTAEEKLGVRPSVAQFVIPLGATINMNGTALYQGVATIFLAQVFGVDLEHFRARARRASPRSRPRSAHPATPGVGIVILSMVLAAAGVPAAGIGLIMGVDRIIDMTRTAVNVTGDLVAAAVLDRVIGGHVDAQKNS